MQGTKLRSILLLSFLITFGCATDDQLKIADPPQEVEVQDEDGEGDFSEFEAEDGEAEEYADEEFWDDDDDNGDGNYGDDPHGNLEDITPGGDEEESQSQFYPEPAFSEGFPTEGIPEIIGEISHSTLDCWVRLEVNGTKSHTLRKGRRLWIENSHSPNWYTVYMKNNLAYMHRRCFQ